MSYVIVAAIALALFDVSFDAEKKAVSVSPRPRTVRLSVLLYDLIKSKLAKVGEKPAEEKGGDTPS